MSMEPEQRRAAKQQMLELMQAGVSWQEAAATAGVQTSRATAYRWKQEARSRGEVALQDGRHGHPAKVLPAVLHWLQTRCQATSLVASNQLQRELQEQLGVQISISPGSRGKKGKERAWTATKGSGRLRASLVWREKEDEDRDHSHSGAGKPVASYEDMRQHLAFERKREYAFNR